MKQDKDANQAILQFCHLSAARSTGLTAIPVPIMVESRFGFCSVLLTQPCHGSSVQSRDCRFRRSCSVALDLLSVVLGWNNFDNTTKKKTVRIGSDSIVIANDESEAEQFHDVGRRHIGGLHPHGASSTHRDPVSSRGTRW